MVTPEHTCPFGLKSKELLAVPGLRPAGAALGALRLSLPVRRAAGRRADDRRALIWLAAPLAFFIGTIGAVSVVKPVYIDKRELKCACVGGGGNVPLGFLSLTENVMMVAMAFWMAAT